MLGLSLPARLARRSRAADIWDPPLGRRPGGDRAVGKGLLNGRLVTGGTD